MVERKKIAGGDGETGTEAWGPVLPDSLFIAALFFFSSQYLRAWNRLIGAMAAAACIDHDFRLACGNPCNVLL